MTAELQRDIGKHDAQIEALDARIQALDRDMREIRDDLRRLFEKLDAINTTLSEAKGGWKTLMWVAGASAAVGGVAVKVVSFLMSK